MYRYIAGALLCLFTAISFAHEEQPDQGWWWDDDWWNNSQIEVPDNYKLVSRNDSYMNGDVEVPVYVVRPAGKKKYPAVLFQHGRRGLDDLVKRLARRIAARGFVVAAPDVYSARFIEKLPIEHDYATEGDVNAGVDYLLGLPDISTKKACLYSHTRGGYYALKVAVSFKRQQSSIACYVSYYPHLQDPNAPEPMQVYRYASEVNDLKIPSMIFVGEKEQYHRLRSIKTAVKALKELGRDVTLITYPGVGRGFDFRPADLRTFADDLASKDAVQRAAKFMRMHLHKK